MEYSGKYFLFHFYWYSLIRLLLSDMFFSFLERLRDKKGEKNDESGATKCNLIFD